MLLSRFINEQLYPYSVFYRRVFDEHHIDPRKIRSVDDLKRLPFTTKADIAPTPEHPARALDLVLRPDKEAIRKYAPTSVGLKLMMEGLRRGRAIVEKRL
ncbi:MAG: hypothetical protein JO098_01460, partial [Candidatus Eremiobacteraeota bacterium]|nr:hypothetical protein [Candidatus Eremiobacteraeota bacterium]